MAAYIEHAAYYTGRLEWYLRFFEEVFQLTPTRTRENPTGLREVWLNGGIQLCETKEDCSSDGRCAHLCLIVDDLEGAREAALARGCSPMDKHHWVKLPDGLSIEMFPARQGAVEILRELVKK